MITGGLKCEKVSYNASLNLSRFSACWCLFLFCLPLPLQTSWVHHCLGLCYKGSIFKKYAHFRENKCMRFALNWKNTKTTATTIVIFIHLKASVPCIFNNFSHPKCQIKIQFNTYWLCVCGAWCYGQMSWVCVWRTDVQGPWEQTNCRDQSNARILYCCQGAFKFNMSKHLTGLLKQCKTKLCHLRLNVAFNLCVIFKMHCQSVPVCSQSVSQVTQFPASNLISWMSWLHVRKSAAHHH